jgi:glycosyltransferase involved in cell wall biosynthesis
VEEPLLISVIIPARNEELFIRGAIASAASQAYPAGFLEVIVVDNGSLDETADVARAWFGEDAAMPSALVAELEPGVGRAKNRGAAAAQGDVLIFLDADSRMDPRLASDVAHARTAGLLAGSIKVYADSSDPVDRGFFALMEFGKVWFGVRGQMLYCDRELFFTVGGFRPDLRLAEDLEFLDRVRAELARRRIPAIGHIRASGIATSARRLRSRPLRLGMLGMFARWALAFAGIGRSREY